MKQINKQKIKKIDFFEIFKEKYNLEPILVSTNNLNYSPSFQKFKNDFKKEIALIDENSPIAKIFGLKAKKLEDVFPQIIKIAKTETKNSNLNLYNILNNKNYNIQKIQQTDKIKIPEEILPINNLYYKQQQQNPNHQTQNSNPRTQNSNPISQNSNQISQNPYLKTPISKQNIIYQIKNTPVQYYFSSNSQSLEQIANSYKFLNKQNNYSLENRINNSYYNPRRSFRRNFY